jgi:hypothetical protein
MTDRALTSGYTIALPVFSARSAPGGAYQIEGEVQGTAFAIGGSFMLTAGHVADAATTEGRHAVIALEGPDGFFKAAKVIEREDLDADVALLKVEFPVEGSERWFHVFRWRETPVEAFETVRCVGYAYGIHNVDGRQSVVARGFQGEVVSRLREFKPLAWPRDPFPVYELSFMAPRGLSGAPLLNSHGHPLVYGMVIGNSQSRMTVFRSEERLAEPDRNTTVEQYEALTLGIAVEGRTILAQGFHAPRWVHRRPPPTSKAA